MLEVYAQGTLVWLPRLEHGWAQGTVLSTRKNESGALQLLAQDEHGKEYSFLSDPTSGKRGADLPPLRNHAAFETAQDLASLHHLNEPSVLHAIQSRYAQRLTYTYSGLALIALNSFDRMDIYGPHFIHKYTDRRRGDLDPHLFAVAEDARIHMHEHDVGQTIIVSGDSGAGKTESAKLIMRFLASRKGGERIGEASEVERRMLATNPILEAFGNAKTVHNDNSSRFGKYLQILFDGGSRIVGAQVRTYLLERSRLVSQSGAERNFHIFYQLFAGLSLSEKAHLHLGKLSDFHYLHPASPVTTLPDGLPDEEEFRSTREAFSTINIDLDTQQSIFRLLAAILHLGNIQISETRGNADISVDDPALHLASDMLGIAPTELRKWMIKRQIMTRSERILTSLNAAQSTSVRDSISKYIYSRAFDWLVTIVNESLSGEDGLGLLMAQSFIGILDIYGFEYYSDSGTLSKSVSSKADRLVNSFEQFCINYANERLQHEFNAHVFKLEQDEYIREKISWSFIDFPDNKPCIDAIESKLGVLSLLDEESRLASGTDASFVNKVLNQWTARSNVIQKARFGNSGFTVAHYAAPVTYESQGFIEKNRDSLPEEHLDMLDTTSNELLRQVLHVDNPSLSADQRPFSPARSESEFTESPTMPAFTGRLNLHPGLSSSASRPPTPGSSNETFRSADAIPVRKQTLATQFKGSLASLMDTISMTNAHYVRCIKPNRQKKAWEFDSKHVLSQLRACGILETVRISCAGYPTRWTYEEFASRYYIILPSSEWTPWPDPLVLCETILKANFPDHEKYQRGKTKLFFRSGSLVELDRTRSFRAEQILALIRRNMLRYRATKYLRTARNAVIVIQRWWRGVLARKVFLKVREDILIKQRAARLLEAQAPNGHRKKRSLKSPLGRAGTKHYHPRGSSTLRDTLEEHFLVWPSDSFADLQQSTMGPRQAIDIPRDSFTLQPRPWPTTNGAYIAYFRAIWNLRAMAMKQLKPGSEPEDVVARFHKEIQVWSRLKQTNISLFIGVFVDAERSVYLVEPWSQNGNVIHYLRSIRPSADRVALLSQIAGGLAYLHEESVIHGDLRGANVAINDVGEAVLTDIGMYKVTLDDSNGTNVMASLKEANAARWMAPELLDPQALSPKMTRESDVYAFSMTAIELYTGNLPLPKIKESKIPSEIVSGTRPERPPIITAPSIQISEMLWILVQRSWNRNPASRPTSLAIKHKLLAERTRR